MKNLRTLPDITSAPKQKISAASTTHLTPGNKEFFVNEKLLKMIKIDGMNTGEMPMGKNDEKRNPFDINTFWLAEREVSYQLWNTVYTWAIDSSRGSLQYTFSNTGTPGGRLHSPTGLTETDMLPVTEVNWRDTIVWCNALTEYYNTINDTQLSVVYCSDSERKKPIRRSTDNYSVETNPGNEDAPYVNTEGSGFRLPSSIEWECAARHKKDTNNIANYNNTTANQQNEKSHPKDVCDMNGNVEEWCFDWHPDYIGTYRVLRGGLWHNLTSLLQVGYEFYIYPGYENYLVGFRIARNFNKTSVTPS